MNEMNRMHSVKQQKILSILSILSHFRQPDRKPVGKFRNRKRCERILKEAANQSATAQTFILQIEPWIEIFKQIIEIYGCQKIEYDE